MAIGLRLVAARLRLIAIGHGLFAFGSRYHGLLVGELRPARSAGGATHLGSALDRALIPPIRRAAPATGAAPRRIRPVRFRSR